MSEENVEIVRRVMETFNRGGPAAVINSRLLSPEIVFDATRAEIPGIGTFRGEDEVRAFFEQDWFSAFPFEEWEIHIEEPVERGDQVIFKSRQQGRGASSGAAAALELGNIFTVRNGEVVRIAIFRHHEDALKAAGLSE
jgi:ketosteroid isomerase-like protein